MDVYHSKNVFLTLLVMLGLVASCSDSQRLEVTSPDGQIQLKVAIVSADNRPVFSIQRSGDNVLEQTVLGLKSQNYDYSQGLSLTDVSTVKSINESYTINHGKRKENIYKANERSFTFSNGEKKSLTITFRVSNDGVGFRYYVPDEENIVITEELTTYNFLDSTKMWVQPMATPKSGWSRTNPSYEEDYFQGIAIGKESPREVGWIYPALFNNKDHWMLITEAAVGSDDCATRLYTVPGTSKMKVGFPQPEEVIGGGRLKPNAAGEWTSPWRIITIGDLETIVTSTLGTDLAEPSIDLDEEFIKPGYASWSWAMLKDSSVTYPVQKKFIDYAADMNWQYCLVDVNWDTMIGYDSIASLSAYAQSKGVGLLLWYNSSGDWNDTEYTPKSKLLTHDDRTEEFARIQKMGIKGIKVDFFGGDGQSVMAYYHELLQDAAAHNLLVNFHGATLPRGWHRTYPNLMTVEAVKGFEYITFAQETANKAATHCAMLPFTRNVFDPMDFTPTAFSDIDNIERKTTDGFELALPTLFLSGVQHIAETPEGMATVPDFVKNYLQDLPKTWDDVKFVVGYPGKEVVIARKSGNVWIVSGINGELKAKATELDLSFLGEASGFIIKDGQGGKLVREEMEVPKDGKYIVNMPPNGGFVIKFSI